MADIETQLTARQIQQALRQRRITPAKAVSYAKNELNWQELQKFTQAYLKPTSIFYPIAFGTASPKSYSEIKIRGLLPNGDLASEMRWAFLSLLTQREALIAMLDKEKRIVGHLLRGDFAAGLTHIDEFENSYGHSLNSLYYRLFTIERISGPKAHKQLLSDINEQSENNIFLILFASYISQRAEASSSAESIEEEIKKLGVLPDF